MQVPQLDDPDPAIILRISSRLNTPWILSKLIFVVTFIFFEINGKNYSIHLFHLAIGYKQPNPCLDKQNFYTLEISMTLEKFNSSKSGIRVCKSAKLYNEGSSYPLMKIVGVLNTSASPIQLSCNVSSL